MIRRLTEADQPALEELLLQSPHYNVYMLGNLSALGMEHEISEFWGDFAQAAGALRGTINRYITGWSVYGQSDADWAGLAAVLDNYPAPAERLQDNPGGIPSLVPHIGRYHAVRLETETLMTLKPADFSPARSPAKCRVRRANRKDLEELTDFYAAAGTMRRSAKGVERPLHDGYFWVAVVDGKIRATALTNAVGGAYAMIGGVYTHPDWRGQGLSQALCSALCTALLDDGLTPTLYWITPEAGHVYAKLGFRPVGHWRSVWLQAR